MRFSALNRKIHYWLSIVLLLPLLVISVTGALLQLKKHIAWVQPTELRAGEGAPDLSLVGLVELAGTAHPPLSQWSDATRIEICPQRNLAKVVGEDGVEVQIDLGRGVVMQTAPRRSDWLEALHDGSWFGDWVKYGWFLPVAVLLLISTLTGLVLFALPYVRRVQRSRREALGVAGSSSMLPPKSSKKT